MPGTAGLGVEADRRGMGAAEGDDDPGGVYADSGEEGEGQDLLNHTPDVECLVKGKTHKPYEFRVGPEGGGTTIAQRWPAGWRT